MSEETGREAAPSDLTGVQLDCKRPRFYGELWFSPRNKWPNDFIGEQVSIDDEKDVVVVTL